MKFSDDDDQEKISRILDWAGDNPDFDDSFIHQMQLALNKHNRLTVGQSEALDNIIAKFDID